MKTKKTLSFYKTKQLQALNAKRKAETRTKIQLGGLLIKSGLVGAFSIQIGADLQLDEQEREKAMILLSALIDFRQIIGSKTASFSQKKKE